MNDELAPRPLVFSPASNMKNKWIHYLLIKPLVTIVVLLLTLSWNLGKRQANLKRNRIFVLQLNGFVVMDKPTYRDMLLLKAISELEVTSLSAFPVKTKRTYH